VKVAVVGGGPGGATAARILAEGGATVYLLERAPNGSKPCGGGLPAVAFREYGLPETLIERTVREVAVYAPSGRTLTISLSPDSLAMVRRSRFDRALRDLAVRSGAVLLEGSCVSLHPGPPPAIRWRPRGSDKEKTLRVDAVIGADGANSRVARAVGAPPARTFWAVQEWIAWEERDDPYAGRCELRFGSSVSPDGYAWIFPKEGMLTVGTGGSFALRRHFPRLLQSLKTQGDSRLVGARVIKREGFPIPIAAARRMTYGRVLLVGDAAGLAMPVSAEGIYYAMKSGALAAWTLLQERSAASPPLSDEPLYDRLWREQYGLPYAVMARLQGIFYKNDAWRERLVRLHEHRIAREFALSVLLKKPITPAALLRYAGFLRMFLVRSGKSKRMLLGGDPVSPFSA
jgi:geranylgeranyl reductase